MASPSRPGRTRRIVLVAAGSAAAAAVGAVLYQDLARQDRFASGTRPCALVSAQTARLVAGPVEGVEDGSVCTWPGPGPQPVLQVQVTRLGTPQAREGFRLVKEEVPPGKTGPMTAELTDFGDEAFSRIRYPGAGRRVTSEIWFRRGDVVVAVRYAPVDGDIDPAHAGAYEVATEAAARLRQGVSAK
ncbi:hypothetical protein EF910_26005 [Streptomyces sp. WAC07149]|uniref:hypothetical protein n=1 Tax=Streptomyces sp. WAC07149 TaxID=2487425 RepID=UPI000F79FCB7|nr:hypothetical protein [Streptomyces sp. WAC07149]RST01799.1 hypothetical protein EF910_26005 [Streptomyces sp. WAC07149]